MANSGRPRKNGLDNIIKFKVDNASANSITNISETTGKSKSDIMREILPIVSSKKFEQMMPHIALSQLEEFSKRCWETLHTPGCLFETSELSQNMPAFVTLMNHPMVNVKYPTYKIQIVNAQDHTERTDCKKIQTLLNTINNISVVYASPANYIANGSVLKKLDFPFLSEVMCLAIELEDNIKAKDEIIQRLTENNYDYFVCPSYCIRSDFIELIENNRYFKILSANE